MILHLIFIRLRPEVGNELFLSKEEKIAIQEETDEIAEALWTPSEQRRHQRHFKTIFCDSNDCSYLKAEIMRVLSQQDGQDNGPD